MAPGGELEPEAQLAVGELPRCMNSFASFRAIAPAAPLTGYRVRRDMQRTRNRRYLAFPAGKDTWSAWLNSDVAPVVRSVAVAVK
jgi:hypothetical protein